jgi:hypothetical protein
MFHNHQLGDEAMSTLEQEVRTLQKQVRRQRRWNIALGAVVVVGGLLAAKGIQEVPEVIRAKKFEVVNGDGRVVAEFKKFLGGGALFLNNKSGKQIVGIGPVPNGGSMLSINGKDGKSAVTIASSPDGGGGVEISQNGEPVGAFLVSSGSGLLGLNSKQGNPTVMLTERNGNGILLTYDSKGKVTSESP